MQKKRSWKSEWNEIHPGDMANKSWSVIVFFVFTGLFMVLVFAYLFLVGLWLMLFDSGARTNATLVTVASAVLLYYFLPVFLSTLFETRKKWRVRKNLAIIRGLVNNVVLRENAIEYDLPLKKEFDSTAVKVAIAKIFRGWFPFALKADFLGGWDKPTRITIVFALKSEEGQSGGVYG